MARPVAAQSLLSLGVSVALVKVIKRFLSESTYEDWWYEHSHVQSNAPTTELVRESVERLDANLMQGQRLTWPQVLNFLVEQVTELDVHFAYFVLFLSVAGPLLWLLLDKESSDVDSKTIPCNEDERVSSSVSTQTEEEPEEKITVRYFHYDPAERALLQFGRSKSESVLDAFKYMPAQKEYTEPEDDIDQMVKRCTLEAEKAHNLATARLPGPKEQTSQECAQEDSAELQHDKSQLPAKQQALLRSSSGIISSTSSRGVPSVKSSRSLLSFKAVPSKSDSSTHSPSFLQLQISPRRTTQVEVQLSPEQAYSQPFTY